MVYLSAIFVINGISRKKQKKKKKKSVSIRQTCRKSNTLYFIKIFIDPGFYFHN